MALLPWPGVSEASRVIVKLTKTEIWRMGPDLFECISRITGKVPCAQINLDDYAVYQDLTIPVPKLNRVECKLLACLKTSLSTASQRATCH